MNRRVFIRGGAAGVAAAALLGGGLVWKQRQADGRVSEDITSEWPEIGYGFWLLPNLVDAFMRVPNRPHSMEEAMNPELMRRIQRTRDFRVNSNANRMRGGPITPQPEPGVFRIACLGDSVTFGWGVEDDQAWPAVLQRQLRAEGIQVECLNVGVPAQSVTAMSAWLQVIGPTLGLSGFVVCERREQMDTPASYAGAFQNARFALPHAKCMVALPPISRFDIRGRSNVLAERDELTARMRGIRILDLTQAVWDAQPQDRGHDLAIEGGGTLIVFERATGVELFRGPQTTQGGLSEGIYRLFEENLDVYEPLMFDAGHPDAEGFIPFAQAIGDTMVQEGWFG